MYTCTSKSKISNVKVTYDQNSNWDFICKTHIDKSIVIIHTQVHQKVKQNNFFFKINRIKLQTVIFISILISYLFINLWQHKPLAIKIVVASNRCPSRTTLTAFNKIIL